MSDTPRTHALLRNGSDDEDQHFAEIVHLAEDLERDLARVTAERDRMKEAAMKALSWIGTHGDDGNYASDALAALSAKEKP